MNKSLLPVVLFSLVISAGPIENLKPGEWLVAPSRLRSVGFQWPSGVTYTRNGVGLDGVMSAWSGGAYDTKRDRLIVWGGGHFAYAGNEIYAFDVNTLSWERINDPSIPVAEDVSHAADGGPCSRHTYDYIQYIPSIDRFCSFGGAGFYPSGQTGTNSTDCFDFDAKKWEKKTAAITSGIGSYSAYDPVSGKAYVYGQNGNCILAEWNPAADTWAARSAHSGCYDYQKTAAVDAKRRVLVAVGGGEVHAWDLSKSGTLTRATVATSGPQNIVSTGNPGFDYDPVSDKFVGWNGGADVFALDLDTKAWIRVTPASSNTITPMAANSNGTYGRFRYIPSKNAFIVVNDVDEYVFIYKLTAGVGTKGEAGSLKSEAGIEVSPNPVRYNATITVLNASWAVRRPEIRIIDARGKRIAALAKGGSKWDARVVSPGLYFVRVEIEGGTSVKPVMVIR